MIMIIIFSTVLMHSHVLAAPSFLSYYPLAPYVHSLLAPLT
jgi:hypothetical protein